MEIVERKLLGLGPTVMFHILTATQFCLKFIPPFNFVDSDQGKWKRILQEALDLVFPTKDPGYIKDTKKL